MPADEGMRGYPNIPAFNSVPKFVGGNMKYMSINFKDFLYREKAVNLTKKELWDRLDLGPSPAQPQPSPSQPAVALASPYGILTWRQ